MNERIKELIHQTNEWMGVNAQGDMWEREQKFAELLLEEVMQELFINGYEDAFNFLNEHFGVE
jgi:hypothetical protein